MAGISDSDNLDYFKNLAQTGNDFHTWPGSPESVTTAVVCYAPGLDLERGQEHDYGRPIAAPPMFDNISFEYNTCGAGRGATP